MRYALLVSVALFIQGNAFANDFEAEAALALAKAKVKAMPDINGPTPAGYEKVSIDGGPWHFQLTTPEVVAPRGTTFHAGHNCPSCGFQSPPRQGTWIVRGHNADGTHTHICPSCGTSWKH